MAVEAADALKSPHILGIEDLDAGEIILIPIYDPEAATDARIEEYRETFANPYIAAARGYVDDVIDPRDTRPRLISALDMLRNKRDENPPKKHGNIPL